MEETQSEAIEMLSQMASRDLLVGHRPGEMQKKSKWSKHFKLTRALVSKDGKETD